MLKLFRSPVIAGQLSTEELEQLTDAFRSYKLTGALPTVFGRDEAYDHAHTLPIIKAEDVRHIHLQNPDEPWPVLRPQYYKTSDFHLVYCPGSLCPDHYLLMAILAPDAHDKAKDNSVMFNLGVMAENFRRQY